MRYSLGVGISIEGPTLLWTHWTHRTHRTHRTHKTNTPFRHFFSPLMSPANHQDTASAGADSPPNSEQLYVLQTIYPNGSVIRGTAGLPYEDMRNYLRWLRNSSLSVGNSTQIIPAPAGTPRLRVQPNTL